MPERQLGEVPEAAVEAATKHRAEKREWHGYGSWEDMPGHARSACRADVEEEIGVAMDPALGDQRLVPAVEVEPHFTFVVAELRQHAEQVRADLNDRLPSPVFLTRLADEMEARARTFGGEPDER